MDCAVLPHGRLELAGLEKRCARLPETLMLCCTTSYATAMPLHSAGAGWVPLTLYGLQVRCNQKLSISPARMPNAV